MKNCYAHFYASRGLLFLGNEKIEKTVRVSGSLYRTESVKDKIRNAEWSGEGLWQQIPVLQSGETAVVEFDTRERRNCLGIKPHLEAVLKIEGAQGRFCMEFMIFPGISFIYSRSSVTAKALGERTDGSEGEADCIGI